MNVHNADKRHPSTRPRRTLLARLALLIAAVAAVVLIAACGGSSSNNSSSSGGGGGSSGTGSGTVKTAKISGYGTALVTSAGKSVYVLSSDPPNGSKCAGSCAKTWMPVTVSGSASAGSGVDSSKLTTFKRKDGTTQVAYDKHALYTYASPGATSGEGVTSEGGKWYLIAPSGSPITKSQAGGY
jgi:predicted lipoprotein with Yx(FWY)xxD motif